MIRSMKSLVLAGALAAASVSAYVLADTPSATQGNTAEGGGKHHGEHRRDHRRFSSDKLVRHAEELGLTAQQLTAIKAAEEAARPEMEKLLQTLHTRREALRTQIDGILTTEQRAKLQEMRGKHRGGRGPGGASGPRQQAPAN